MFVHKLEMPRVRGYHYVRGAGGRKRRVYGRGGASFKRPRRGTTKRGMFKTIYGSGKYYSRRPPQNAAFRGAGGVRRTKSGRRGMMSMIGFGGTDPPKMVGNSTGFTVTHREYIQDITSSVPFIAENFALNPGMIQTFPWLSQIADNFEEWIPEAMIFEYKSMSSASVVNTTNSNPGLGTVVMATQYNSYNPTFASKQQMQNYENAVSTDPSRSMIHAIECERFQSPVQPLYVRTGALVDNATTRQDLRLYDHGVMTIATTSQQSNNFVIGELWCSYRIRFLKPRLDAGVGNNEQGVVDYFSLDGTNLPATPFGTNINALQPPFEGSTLGGVISGGIVPLGAGGAQQVVDFPLSLGGRAPFQIFGPLAGGLVSGGFTASTISTYYFPPGISSGLFMCVYMAAYGVPGVEALQSALNQGGGALTTALSGCVAANPTGNADAQFRNGAATTTTSDMVVFFIRVTSNYARFQMIGTAGMTTPGAARSFFVRQMPEGIQSVP